MPFENVPARSYIRLLASMSPARSVSRWHLTKSTWRLQLWGHVQRRPAPLVLRCSIGVSPGQPSPPSAWHSPRRQRS